MAASLRYFARPTLVKFDDSSGIYFISAYVAIATNTRSRNDRPPDANYLLVQRSLEGGDGQVLAQFYGSEGSLGLPPWSTDGRRLVFVSREPEAGK